jgi:hypothetical protein
MSENKQEGMPESKQADKDDGSFVFVETQQEGVLPDSGNTKSKGSIFGSFKKKISGTTKGWWSGKEEKKSQVNTARAATNAPASGDDAAPMRLALELLKTNGKGAKSRKGEAVSLYEVTSPHGNASSKSDVPTLFATSYHGILHSWHACVRKST